MCLFEFGTLPKPSCKTSGVVQFVGNHKGAVSIRDKEISHVRAVLERKINLVEEILRGAV
jgi:hypothetical protein